MATEFFKAIASFQDDDGNPLTGSEFSVVLMDEDRFFDDKLGDSSLNSKGEAEFLIATADILSLDSSGERTPDIYFCVKKSGSQIYQSEVFPNVNFEVKDDVTGRTDALTIPFGPFVVSGA